MNWRKSIGVLLLCSSIFLSTRCIPLADRGVQELAPLTTDIVDYLEQRNIRDETLKDLTYYLGRELVIEKVATQRTLKPNQVSKGLSRADTVRHRTITFRQYLPGKLITLRETGNVLEKLLGKEILELQVYFGQVDSPDTLCLTFVPGNSGGYQLLTFPYGRYRYTYFGQSRYRIIRGGAANALLINMDYLRDCILENLEAKGIR